MSPAYYLLLWMLAMMGPGAFRSEAYFVFGPSGLISYLLLLGIVLWLGFVLDAGLGHRTGARFAVAGAAASFVSYTIVSSWTLEVTSVDALDLLFAFGFDVRDLLGEIDLGLGWTLAIPSVVIIPFLLGGLLHQRFTRYAIPRRGPLLAALVTVALVASYAGEQAVARKIDPNYLTRQLGLPIYVQAIPAEIESFTFALPPPRSAAERARLLADVRPAANPRHVLFVLLESLRIDVMSPEEMPTLARLATESLLFPGAHTEAIFSPASWTVLLLDESSLTDLWEQTVGEDEAGSWPLQVMKAAGYTVWISFSGSLIEGFDERLLGRGASLDRAYHPPGDVLSGYRRDDLAVRAMLDWIDGLDASEPHLLFLQLDATHYPYTFREEDAPYRPYSPAVLPHHLDDQEEIDLVHTRYRNAARYVDDRLAEVLTRLDDRDLLEETAIVVVSDHGEGFTEGRVGHTVLHAVTKRVPMFLRLPDIPARDVASIVPSGHVWPTLCDYLGIEASFRRGSLLEAPPAESAAVTHSPLKNLVDLTYPGGAVRFFVRHRAGEIHLIPFAVLDRNDGYVDDWSEALSVVPWREMLRESVIARD